MSLEGPRINMVRDTKIKLCGLKRECDIMWANEISPDMIGFVFYEKSRRYVNVEDAKRLREKLLPQIKAVGVFVNESPKKEAELVNNGIIDYIQLHGSEKEEHISLLRKMCDSTIIQAFRIENEEDIKRAGKSIADIVLLDCGDGGSGNSFDWNLAVDFNKKYILAGGLDISNIKSALLKLSPWGVDVSSGIETDGFKDRDKMIDFANAVRSFENNVRKGDSDDKS